MTLTHTETSSLRAAREWRGIALAVAARTSGLSMAQAEALEDGRPDAFGGVDEMIAAAVLYGASLGIGSEEATALLDRTIAGAGQAPTTGTAAFSQAVRDRSTTIAGRDTDGDDTPGTGSLQLEPLTLGTAVETTGDLPALPPTEITGDVPVLPSSAIDAASRAPQLSENPTVQAAMQLDPGWRRALEQSHSELEQWAAVRPAGGGSQLAARLRELTEKTLGQQRAARLAEAVERGSVATRHQVTGLRSRMERSEHATLLIALGVGAVLIALLIALASALGGGDTPAPVVTKPAKTATAEPATATRTEPRKPAPMLRPKQIKIDVLNAGSKAGYANEVADKLAGTGYRIGEVGNTQTQYQSAIILHPKNLRREALRLSRQTGVTTMDILPESRGANYMMLVLV